MSPLISVIVPVYNKEKYVAECLNSILNQTYSNIEVIIIDDGSTDKSLEICMRYAEEDKRVKVFPQENGGPSAARNKGLDNAKGEYVAFVDADDILERNAYTLMVNELIDTKASIVVVGMKYLYKNGTRVVQFPEMDRCELDANEFMRLFFNNNIMCFSSVNKMYLREIIGETRFDTKIKMSEDQKFVYEIMKKVNKTVYNPTVCYNINFTDKSLSRSVPTRYHLAQLDVSEYIYSELSDEEAKKMARAYMVYLCLTVFVPYYNGGDFTKEDISRVNCIIKDNIGVTFLKGSMTTRIKLLLYLISPSLLRYVFLKRESLKRDRV